MQVDFSLKELGDRIAEHDAWNRYEQIEHEWERINECVDFDFDEEVIPFGNDEDSTLA